MNYNNIIDFNSKKETLTEALKKRSLSDIQEELDMVSYPTQKEISILNAVVEQFSDEDPNMPIPAYFWNGDCMHTVFNEMSNYAKEIQADPWDTFALFIHKLHGMKIIENEDGGASVKYEKD